MALRKCLANSNPGKRYILSMTMALMINRVAMIQLKTTFHLVRLFLSVFLPALSSKKWVFLIEEEVLCNRIVVWISVTTWSLNSIIDVYLSLKSQLTRYFKKNGKKRSYIFLCIGCMFLSAVNIVTYTIFLVAILAIFIRLSFLETAAIHTVRW